MNQRSTNQAAPSSGGGRRRVEFQRRLRSLLATTVAAPPLLLLTLLTLACIQLPIGRIECKGLVGKLPGNPASCPEEPCNSDPQHVLNALKWMSLVFGLILLLPLLMYYISKLISKVHSMCFAGSASKKASSPSSSAAAAAAAAGAAAAAAEADDDAIAAAAAAAAAAGISSSGCSPSSEQSTLERGGGGGGAGKCRQTSKKKKSTDSARSGSRSSGADAKKQHQQTLRDSLVEGAHPGTPLYNSAHVQGKQQQLQRPDCSGGLAAADQPAPKPVEPQTGLTMLGPNGMTPPPNPLGTASPSSVSPQQQQQQQQRQQLFRKASSPLPADASCRRSNGAGGQQYAIKEGSNSGGGGGAETVDHEAEDGETIGLCVDERYEHQHQPPAQQHHHHHHHHRHYSLFKEMPAFSQLQQQQQQLLKRGSLKHHQQQQQHHFGPLTAGFGSKVHPSPDAAATANTNDSDHRPAEQRRRHIQPQQQPRFEPSPLLLNSNQARAFNYEQHRKSEGFALEAAHSARPGGAAAEWRRQQHAAWLRNAAADLQSPAHDEGQRRRDPMANVEQQQPQQPLQEQWRWQDQERDQVSLISKLYWEQQQAQQQQQQQQWRQPQQRGRANLLTLAQPDLAQHRHSIAGSLVHSDSSLGEPISCGVGGGVGGGQPAAFLLHHGQPELERASRRPARLKGAAGAGRR